MDGNMRVEVQGQGFQPVSSLQPGTYVRGVDRAGSSAWCEVRNLNAKGQGLVLGNFTPGHYIQGPNGDVQKSISVSTAGELNYTEVFNFATSCPLVIAESGDRFTPLATDMCSFEMSYSDYLYLFDAMTSLVADTGAFWFDIDHFVDTQSETWQAATPPVCEAMLQCAKVSTLCSDFG